MQNGKKEEACQKGQAGLSEHLTCEICGRKINPDTSCWQEDEDGMCCQECWAEKESCGCSD